MTDWTATVIWWQVHTLTAVGSHRLGRLEPWLDHLVGLGANGLLLGPVFTSVSHGYDTLDHLAVDPRLGDLDDFDALVAAARSRGVRVCLDGVFNHLSRDHEIVQRALADGPSSDAGRWIRWSGEHAYGFEGNDDLVELDLTHPPVAAYVADVMTHWLDRGVDGWRLDAAFAAGASTWRPILDRVRAAHPDAWIVAELLGGDYAGFVTDSGVDSVTAYELWKAVWSSLNDANLHELAWTLTRHAELTATCRPQTFLGNHDTTRLASRLDDPRHLPPAVALLMTLPGVPSVYAGDEWGATGVKEDRPGGDDALRPELPDPGSVGSPLTDTYRELIALRRRHPWLVDAALDVVEVDNPAIGIRLTSGSDALLLALNVSDEERTVAGLVVPPHGYAVGEPT